MDGFKSLLYIFVMTCFLVPKINAMDSNKIDQRKQLIMSVEKCIEKQDMTKKPSIFSETCAFSSKKGSISIVAFSKKGNRFALVKDNECIVKKNKEKINVRKFMFKERITACAFYNKHLIIGTMGAKDNLFILDREKGNTVSNLGGLHDEKSPHITHIVCHPEHNHFISVGYFDSIFHKGPLGERTIRFCDQKNIKAIEWSPDRTYFISSNDESIILRDGDSGQLIRRIGCPAQRIVWNLSGELFVSVSDNEKNNFVVWDSKTKKNIHDFTDCLVSVASDSEIMVDSSNLAISVGVDLSTSQKERQNRLMVPNKESRNHYFRFSGESDSLEVDDADDETLLDTIHRQVLFSSKGNCFIAVSEKHKGKNNEIIIRDGKTFAIVHTFVGPIIGDTVTISPNGKYLSFVEDFSRNIINLYDCEKKEIIGSYKCQLNENVHFLKWHPNGKSIVSCSDNTSDIVWWQLGAVEKKAFNALKDEKAVSRDQVRYILDIISGKKNITQLTCDNDALFRLLPISVKNLLVNYDIIKKS